MIYGGGQVQSASTTVETGNFCHGATEGIFVAIDLEAHVKCTGTP